MSVMVADLGKQIKITDIVSSYPQTAPEGGLTSIGSIARGAVVNDTTTRQMADASFKQGQFFKAFSRMSFNQLTRIGSSDGDEHWSYTKTIEGVDHSVTIIKSDILRSITLVEVKDQSEIEAVAREYHIDKQETYITIDGKKYFVRINIPLYFGTGTESNIIVETLCLVVGTEGLSAAIAGVAAALGVDAFTTVLTNIHTQVFQVLWSLVTGVVQVSYAFLQAFIGAIIGGEGVAAALVAGQAAVGAAVAEGVFSAITAAALAYTVVGILIIAAIYLVLTFVLHYTYQHVFIYNLTGYDLDFEFGHIYEGSPYNINSKHIPAYRKQQGPNNIDLGAWYSATGFRFQSDSQFHGIGYAMTLSLKEAGTQIIRKQMACMFDIPYIGHNSLRASATMPANIRKFYINNEGVVAQTQDVASDNDLELIVTYDYLRGKHRDPETGGQDYIYNSLIIVREKPIDSFKPSAYMKDNSFLRIATSDAYHFGNGDFTLEAWIKPFSPGTIFGKKSSDGGSSDCAGFLLVLQPNGSIKLATDNGYGYYQTISDASNIFNGDWHHIAGVRSNGALSLYVDGQPIRSTASGSLPSPLNVSNDLPLLIGSVQQHQETYIHYSGALSEVRLWKVALQRSLIQQVMNSKLTGSEAGLVGYWPLRSNGDDLSPNKNRACPAGNVSFGDN